MKIAFPVKEDKGLDSLVNDHFGVAELFLVVDLESGDIQTRTNQKIENPNAGCKTKLFHDAESVDAMVTKCIGDGGQRNMHGADICVYAAQKDTVGENLELMKSGDLQLFHMFDLCQGKKNKKQGGCGHHH
ncbi:MAG: dinitrogenase iron-molybdenum cofactor [Desulfotignum sp.]|nr:dinitrogenase iron-molybdenum cofactor [Desulfotignum sp.]MCF8136750.1 dinitrogenase iron-molybdenum cofactor [Desulfotignum sp.]